MRYDKEIRVLELATEVARVALSDTLDAKPGEPFTDALQRKIDQRLLVFAETMRAAQDRQRWWRFWT